MKNRKTVVVAFLLVAAMLLGVGYAALTDTLNVAGDFEVSHANAENAFDEEVYFSNVSSGQGYTAQILADPDNGYVKVTGLAGIGDAISVTYTIKNDNDFPVSVIIDAINTSTTNTEYFSVSSDLGNTAFTIGANSTQDVVLTFTLLKTPILAENQTVSGTFTVEYDVTSVG